MVQPAPVERVIPVFARCIARTTDCRGKVGDLLAPKPQSDLGNWKAVPALNSEMLQKQQLMGNQRVGRELLRARFGQTTCLPPFADVRHEIRIANCDRGCTRPTTQVHEETHASDILDCCRRWRAAARPVFTARSPDPAAARRLYLRWLAWVEANSHYFESRAYWNSLQALRRLHHARGCNHPTAANRACCDRISRWIREETDVQRAHHRASRPLTACPWPAVSGGGPLAILQTGTCTGVRELGAVVTQHDEHMLSLARAGEERGGSGSAAPTEPTAFCEAEPRTLLIYHRNVAGGDLRGITRRMWRLSAAGTTDPREAGATILWDRRLNRVVFYGFPLASPRAPNSVRICCPPRSSLRGRDIIGTIHTHPFPPDEAQQEPTPEDITAVSRIPQGRCWQENYVVGLEDVFVFSRSGRWFRIGRRESMLGT